MPRGPRNRDELPQPPHSFPDTTPPLGLDHSSFTLQTIMTMQSTLGGLSKQVDTLSAQVEDLGKDVRAHGKWIYAANALAILAFGAMCWTGKEVWDLLKDRISIAAPSVAPASAPAVSSPNTSSVPPASR